MKSAIFIALFAILTYLLRERIYEAAVPYGLQLFESNQLPDYLSRLGARALLAKRLKDLTAPNNELQQAAKQKFVDDLKAMPIAVEQTAANEQHYEIDSRFYHIILGKNLKYSSAYFPANATESEASALLDQAENTMLQTYADRAQISRDSKFKVLDLGCGWGSFSLWIAAYCPGCEVIGLSNSNTQREWIMQQAAQRGLTNLRIRTGDITVFEFESNPEFDRIVSIEMFEHMKNYQFLFKKVSNWLKPDGLMFVHIFVHKSIPYHFIVESEDDWMSKYFFTGGTMPSADLFFYFHDHLALQKHWHVNGHHYAMTGWAWLQKLDQNEAQVRDIFKKTYGEGQETLWIARWRGFFLALIECFDWDNGNEWFVAHYLFKRR